MFKNNFNARPGALHFKHFTHRSYALFSCLGREVLICTLSVATLTNAKAEGISTKPVASALALDSLSREEVKLDRSLHCSRQRLWLSFRATTFSVRRQRVSTTF